MSENTYNPNHPHGAPDPQWIAPNGSCSLCGRMVVEQREADLRAAKAHAADLQGEVARLTDELRDAQHVEAISIDQMRDHSSPVIVRCSDESSSTCDCGCNAAAALDPAPTTACPEYISSAPPHTDAECLGCGKVHGAGEGTRS